MLSFDNQNIGNGPSENGYLILLRLLINLYSMVNVWNQESRLAKLPCDIKCLKMNPPNKN